MFTRARALERAMTAAFLYSGFEEAERRPGLNDDYEPWSDACGGGIGIVETLAEFAFLIEDTLENTPVYAGSDYPGVLAYDVVVPLGSWLYTCGSPPTDAVFLAKLHERLSEWFGVPNPALQPPPPPPELTVTTERFRTVDQIAQEMPDTMLRADMRPSVMAGQWFSAGVAAPIGAGTGVLDLETLARSLRIDPLPGSRVFWSNPLGGNPSAPIVVPKLDIEDWKDRISRELFTRYRVSIDDIGMRDDQFTEHLYKSPAEFADWWNAQRGTV